MLFSKNIKKLSIVGIVFLIILLVEFFHFRFKSSIEYKAARSFLFKSKNIKQIMGGVMVVDFIEGVKFTDNEKKSAVYMFILNKNSSKKINVRVYQEESCNGFMIRAKFIKDSIDLPVVCQLESDI